MVIFVYLMIVINGFILLMPARSRVLARIVAGYNAIDFYQYLGLLDRYSTLRLPGGLNYAVVNSAYSRFPIAITMLALTGLAIAIGYFERSNPRSLQNKNIQHIVQAPRWLISPIVALSYAFAIAILVYIGPSKLWLYTGYGSIKTGALTDAYSSIMLVVGILFRIFTVVLCATLFPQIRMKNYAFVIISVPIICFSIILGLAEASRIIAVYAVVLGAGAFLVGKKFSALTMLLLSFLFVMYSLEARSHRDLGLSRSVEFFSEIFDSEYAISDSVQNITMRGILTNASVNRGSPAGYSTLYKVLSFSPLPNTLDGFQKQKSRYEQRVLEWVPFTSFAEATLFGPVYFMVFWGILIFSGYCVVSTRRFGNIYVLISIGMFLLALFYAGQYPIRNSVRLFYAVIAFRFIIVYTTSRQSRRGRQRDHVPADIRRATARHADRYRPIPYGGRNGRR